MRRLAALALLLLLVPAAGAKGQACTDEAPCVLAFEAGDGTLTVSPAQAGSLGPFVVQLHNAGGANTTLAELNFTVEPGATRTSGAFVFPQDGAYTFTAQPGGATAQVSVHEVVELPPGEWGDKSANLLSIVLPILIGVALIGIAILVLRHGRIHRHNRFFAAYYLLSGLKSFAEGIDGAADGFHAASPLFPGSFAWQLVAAFCALGIAPALLLFIASFPRPLEALTRRPALAALVVVPSIIVGALFVGAIQGKVSPETFGVAASAFNVYGTALTVLALVYILRATRSSERIERTQARFVVVGFLPAFVVGWVITLLQILPDYNVMDATLSERYVQDLIHFISPVLELLSAGAVALAILRFNILGISPRFRLGVKTFLVGFIFVVVFLATQFIENVVLQGQLFNFAGEYGSFMLSGIAGIILFKPIESVSNKAADRLVPKPKEDEALARNADVYRAQCIYVLRDAQVSEREMAFLRNLRDQLGLSEAQARGIEEDVERTLKVDAPQTGASAGTAPAFIAQAAADLAGAPEVHRASPAPQAAEPAGATPPKRAARKAPAKPKPKPSKPAKKAASGRKR